MTDMNGDQKRGESGLIPADYGATPSQADSPRSPVAPCTFIRRDGKVFAARGVGMRPEALDGVDIEDHMARGFLHVSGYDEDGTRLYAPTFLGYLYLNQDLAKFLFRSD